jgi:hypothetical protein
MTDTAERLESSDAAERNPDAGPGRELADSGDRLLLIGSILTGTFLGSIIGGPMMIQGIRKIRRAAATGYRIRPWPVTIIGLYILIDTANNAFGWALDAFAHDTELVQTLFSGIGRLVDAGYYIHYNNTDLGGTSASGEKAIQLACVLFVFPMRLAATWGFLKMKRWGYHYLIVTSWLYALVWVYYAINLTITFDNRIGASQWGMVGYWIIDIPFFGAFFTLPYLYVLNSKAWCCR